MKGLSLEPGEYEFHQWMQKYWGGVVIEWNSDAEEYSGKAQIAWEAWQKFWPKKDPKDGKIWMVTMASRYRDGELAEHFDVSTLSSMHPLMVEYADFAALHKRCQDLEEELKNIKRCMCP